MEVVIDGVRYVPERVAARELHTEDGIVGHATCTACGRRAERWWRYCAHCRARFEEER